MANVYAIKNGNWSDPTLWNTGALPAIDDSVYSNNFTVQVDISVTVVSVSNGPAAPIVMGGTFNLLNGITIVCTSLTPLRSFTTNSPVLIQFNGALGTSANIVGNFQGSFNNGGNTITNNNTGTLNVTGSFFSGATNFACAAYNASTGILNVTGTCTGAGTPTGNVNAIGNNISLNNPSTQGGTCNIVGDLIGNYAVHSWGILNHTGTATAGSGPAITSQPTGSTNVLSGPLINNGKISAIYCSRFRFKPNTPARWRIFERNVSNGQDIIDRTLYTPGDYPNMPVTADVRKSTAYGPANTLTGTLSMPNPAQVRAGVPIDTSVGTAVLDPASFWASPISGMTTTGSIGERLKNAATVETVGEQWATG